MEDRDNIHKNISEYFKIIQEVIKRTACSVSRMSEELNFLR